MSDLHAQNASLTTHALDISKGIPAANLAVELFRIGVGSRKSVLRTVTNAQGRCDAPLLTETTLEVGAYVLEFDAKSYFGASTVFETIPVEFNISDRLGHYHVPLVLAPGGYSTYRGAPPHRAPDDRGRWAPSVPKPQLPNESIAAPPGVGGAGLTVHIIDIARGIGASGLEGEIFETKGGRPRPLANFVVNDEGRTDQWLIKADQLQECEYEIVLRAGEYYSRAGFGVGPSPFLERIRIRPKIHNPTAHHHIPLLLSPWGYSCYRGS